MTNQAILTKKPRLRLFVPQGLMAQALLELDGAQSHYVAHVMRGQVGERVLVFNGADGEWLAEIAAVSKKSVGLTVLQRVREQKACPDVWLAFAPIKNKVDFVVEKAVELGVSALLPVFTRHAIVRSLNHEKLQAYVIEAAEQCERMDVPRIQEFKDMAALLAAWPEDRILFYADETGGGTDLKTLLPCLSVGGKYGVLIGPEGGFAAEERALLRAQPQVRAFGLGPRVLRADTAMVAALACVQAWLGDWQEQPHFEAGE